MDELVRQIRIALDNKLYYLALYITLTLPDISGALNSDDGIATKERYIDWFDKYVTPQNADPTGDSLLTGEVAYQLRCSLLHQGKMELKKQEYSRIIFSTPEGMIRAHCCKHQYDDGEIVLQLDVLTFCNQVLSGLDQFLSEHGNSEQFQKNYKSFIAYYPNGISPYAIGIPLIG